MIGNVELHGSESFFQFLLTGLDERLWRRYWLRAGNYRLLSPHLLWEQGVEGSNPLAPTINSGGY